MAGIGFSGFPSGVLARQQVPRVSAAACVLALAFAACNSSPTASPPYREDPEYRRIAALPDDTSKLRQLWDYIHAYAADRTCSGPGQCRVVRLGVDPSCGFALGYLVYSTGAVDSTAVTELVGELIAVQNAVLTPRPPPIVCPAVVFPPPKVGCVDGNCEQIR